MNKIVERTVKVALTETELLDRGEKLAYQVRELESAESDLASYKAHVKMRTEACKTQISKMQNAINDKAEWREMNCDEVFNYELRVVVVRRPDTGEVVDSREMTEAEAQSELALDKA